MGIVPPGIELPFNGCPLDACEHLSTGDCSVEVGEELVYEMQIPILDAYPTIEIEGKWMLKDDYISYFNFVKYKSAIFTSF